MYLSLTIYVFESDYISILSPDSIVIQKDFYHELEGVVYLSFLDCDGLNIFSQ